MGKNADLILRLEAILKNIQYEMAEASSLLEAVKSDDARESLEKASLEAVDIAMVDDWAEESDIETVSETPVGMEETTVVTDDDDDLPEAEPETVRDTVPEPVPETTPEIVPEAVHEAAPEIAPDAAPEEVASETVPEYTQEVASEVGHETAPEDTPEVASEDAQDAAPEVGREVGHEEMGQTEKGKEKSIFEDEDVFSFREQKADTKPAQKKSSRLAVVDALLNRESWRTAIPGSPVRDIRSAIALNDRILFINSLFKGDAEAFRKVVDDANKLLSLDELVDYIHRNCPDWDTESDTVFRFIMAVRRKLR